MRGSIILVPSLWCLWWHFSPSSVKNTPLERSRRYDCILTNGIRHLLYCPQMIHTFGSMTTDANPPPHATALTFLESPRFIQPLHPCTFYNEHSKNFIQ